MGVVYTLTLLYYCIFYFHYLIIKTHYYKRLFLFVYGSIWYTCRGYSLNTKEKYSLPVCERFDMYTCRYISLNTRTKEKYSIPV